MDKQHRGRPRKQGDTIKSRRFARAAMVMSAYDEARREGQKHSVAIRHAVDTVRNCSPATSISDSEVRRILSTFRPRGSATILVFERSDMTETDENRILSMLQQIPLRDQPEFPKLPARDEMRPKTKLTMRFSERPNYPRHNRKSPKK